MAWALLLCSAPFSCCFEYGKLPYQTYQPYRGPSESPPVNGGLELQYTAFRRTAVPAQTLADTWTNTALSAASLPPKYEQPFSSVPLATTSCNAAMI